MLVWTKAMRGGDNLNEQIASVFNDVMLNSDIKKTQEWSGTTTSVIGNLIDILVQESTFNILYAKQLNSKVQGCASLFHGISGT